MLGALDREPVEVREIDTPFESGSDPMQGHCEHGRQGNVDDNDDAEGA